jgi:Family of unknown function (DUF5335)
MSIRRLERDDWSGFCIRASRFSCGKRADIEVVSLQMGFQPGARQLPLIGMSYDPKGDVLHLLLDTLSHSIRAPRELYVDEEPLGIVSFAVIDAEGVQQIVTFRDPLLLPATRLSRS